MKKYYALGLLACLTVAWLLSPTHTAKALPSNQNCIPAGQYIVIYNCYSGTINYKGTNYHAGDMWIGPNTDICLPDGTGGTTFFSYDTSCMAAGTLVMSADWPQDNPPCGTPFVGTGLAYVPSGNATLFTFKIRTSCCARYGVINYVSIMGSGCHTP